MYYVYIGHVINVWWYDEIKDAIRKFRNEYVDENI